MSWASQGFFRGLLWKSRTRAQVWMWFGALLRQGVSHPKFCGDVICRLWGVFGHGHFDALFPGRVEGFIGRGYGPVVLQHTACLVVGPYAVGNRACLFDCAMTGRT